MGSDPGHCTKILTNPLYAASINPKTIAYVKKSFGYAINQGHGDTLETLKGRMIFAENHMCGLHTTCEDYFPWNFHMLHQEQGKAHKPVLPYKNYFTSGLPPAVKRAWDKVTTDPMLRQCLHPYHTHGNEACNNSFTNCEIPKTRCQYAGTPVLNFHVAMFVLRQTTVFLGLLLALE